MEKRVLGRTGLKVTVLGYGAMAINDPEKVSDTDAERILGSVLDAGINFIDTAPDYGPSEERIGRFISHRRSEFFLATKCGCNITAEGNRLEPTHLWTRERLTANIEQSLQRMRTDYVDVWQLHNPSVKQVDEGGLVEAMEDVKRSGKVRHVSISSGLPDILTFIERGIFDTYQIPYSAMTRGHESAISKTAESGFGVIIRRGAAKGFADSSSRDPDTQELWQKAKLEELLSPGESRTQFVLRFTITHPGVSTAIVGTKNPDHLKANLAVADSGVLSDDIYEEAKRRLDAVGESPEIV